MPLDLRTTAPDSSQKDIYLHTDDINMPAASGCHSRDWLKLFCIGNLMANKDSKDGRMNVVKIGKF
jgi:hypothetical protein